MSAPFGRVAGEELPVFVLLALTALGALCSLAAATSWLEPATAQARVPQRDAEQPAGPRAPEPEAPTVAAAAPEAPTAPPSCTPDTLLFEASGARPTASASARLHTLGAWLVAHPSARATLDGHADALGEPNANLALSQRRASAVRALLVNAGAHAEQLTLRWFGAFAPLDERRADGAENRRVVIRVLGDACPPAAEEPFEP